MTNSNHQNISKLVVANPKDLKAYIYKVITKFEHQLNPHKTVDNSTTTTSNWLGLKQNLDQLETLVNIMTIVPAKTKKYIALADLAPVFHFAHQKPHLSQYNYLIIGPLESMRMDAQNKLLKLVEEPPENTNVILFAEYNSEAAIPTIRSRVDIVNLKSSNIDPQQLDEYIELIKSFLKSKQDAMEAYSRLEKMLKQEKSSDGKRLLWQNLSLALTKISRAYLNKYGTNEKAKNTFLTLNNISNYLDSAQKYNANHKLRLLRVWQEFLHLHL